MTPEEALDGRGMKISALLRTSDYRGDHAADVTIAFEVLPGETVEALILRTRKVVSGRRVPTDWIELREVAEPKP